MERLDRTRLALLAAAVLAAHALALRGARPSPPPLPAPWVAAFDTRSVEAAPVAPAAPAAPVAAPAPVFKQKMPASRAQLASPATKLIAEPAPAGALAIPPPARHRYRVTAQTRGESGEGDAELLFRHDGRNYEAQLDVRLPQLPARTQKSAGAIGAEGLAPLRFSEKTRREEAAHFVREEGRLVFSSNRPDAPLEAGAQDRLSVLLQLAARVGGAPHKYPPGTVIALQTAGTRDAGVWTFSVQAEEELQLPGGQLRTLKLLRSPRHEYDPQLELWLAPGLDYAPARVRLTSPNGDWTDQQWSATDRP